jgi:CRISPR-associated protein Cst1
MIQNQINYLTITTGDPFADIGGHVIDFFREDPRWKDKPIIDLIEHIAKVYALKWDARINAFFLNSTITQASFKGDQKVLETLKYFRRLIDGTEPHQMGYCRISGQYTQLFTAGRNNYMLAGSGAFINFNHSFDEGIRFSKEVLIRLFFVPFGVRQIGAMVGVISSNNDLITKHYVWQNCRENSANISSGMSLGVLKYEIGNPYNAIFDFARKCVDEIDGICKQESEFPIPKLQTTINLFHFTNFAASPDIQIHTLKSDVFEFIAFCQGLKVRKDWQKFVKAHYYNSKYAKAIFNEESEKWENSKESLDFEDFKNWRNRVFDNLINGKSLTRLFAKWSQNHTINFILLTNYLTKIRNMNKKTIEKIQFLADYVVKGQDKDFIAKTIKKLDGTKGAYMLRRILLKWIGDNAKSGNSPLITVEDYVNYLFSDNSNWSEIRDVLIIAIYQKSHEKQIQIEVDLEEETIISEPEN